MERVLESHRSSCFINCFLLVSIIIPVYNSQAFLADTIESALCQTYRSKEIIIVDDGSTDNSYAIAKSYERDGVIVIQQANTGAAVARNTGMARAKGEYIQFLDAGDLLDIGKIEMQIEALKGQTNKLAVCDFLQFGSEEELKKPHYPDQSHFIYSSDQPLDFLVKLWGGKGEANFIQTNCWLVPQALIAKVGGWRPYRCPDDDGEFFARLALASDGIVYVPGVYNYFRVGPGANQLSGNTNPEYLKNTLLTIQLKQQYLEQKGAHPGIKKAIATQYLHFAVYNYPAQASLADEAYRRYRQLDERVVPPELGGKMVECVKYFFGWRLVRWVQYHLREKRE
jgi:GT2 family glycosyltransferase